MDAPGISGAVGVSGKHIRTSRRRSFESATVHYQNERGDSYERRGNSDADYLRNDNRSGVSLIRRGGICEQEERKVMQVYLDESAKLPTRAHATDAGLDLYSRDYKVIPGRGSKTFDTGVHVKLPSGTAGLLVSKSGLNVTHGITSTGLIDEGYTGSIVVKLYNNTDDDYRVFAGDKISQLIIIPVMYETPEVVEQLDDTDRGNGGFGSTGR